LKRGECACVCGWGRGEWEKEMGNVALNFPFSWGSKAVES
jgi:hypothetical protein